jgi:hypothetical protein
MLSLEGLSSPVVWTSFFKAQEKVFHFWKKYTFFKAVNFFPIFGSVADPGCLARISDPKTATKEKGEQKICYQTFFCSHKFHKIENHFIF